MIFCRRHTTMPHKLKTSMVPDVVQSQAQPHSRAACLNLGEKKDSTGHHHLDIITMTIPFLFLLFLILLICMLAQFSTSARSSHTGYSKHSDDLTPSIQITEPSSSVGAFQDIFTKEADQPQFNYLSPKYAELKSHYNYSNSQVKL